MSLPVIEFVIWEVKVVRFMKYVFNSQDLMFTGTTLEMPKIINWSRIEYFFCISELKMKK